MDKAHHAPWRQDPTKSSGSLDPIIFNQDSFNSLKSYGASLRLVLATCDYLFLTKYIDRLVSYQKSKSSIPFAVGVYASAGEELEVIGNLQKIKEDLGLEKILFFVFNSKKLEWVLSNQKDPEIKWDYKINYIRCARYNLVLDIWRIVGIESEDLSIAQSSIYVVDFDNVFKEDVNHAIKDKFGRSQMVFSWNSAQSPNKFFPYTLSGLTIKDGSLSTNHPYKIVKAGFTVLAPSQQSRRFLWLFKAYSIGDDISTIFMRLFTFYFSDQVAILLSLMDIKSIIPHEYMRDVNWIDINSSSIVNLKNEFAKYMFYPKGKNFQK